MVRKYVVKGGQSLSGEVSISGAKNAVTKQMVASLLTKDEIVLKGTPQIGDVTITEDILRSLGTVIDKKDGNLFLKSDKLFTSSVPLEFSEKNRIPILMAGPLLHRFGEAKIPMMGGCKIGQRPLGFHLDGLKALGVEIKTDDKYYYFTCKKMKGAFIDLPFPSVGATENLLMSAVLAQGKTIIKNAAVEPEIVDLVILLQSMGAIIYQEIDRSWIIEGVSELKGSTHQVIKDRIEAASFAVSAITNDGDVVVEGADIIHLQSFLNAIRKVGGIYEVLDHGIRFYRKQKKLQPISLETGVHPGFMTDWQQPFVMLLTQAEGVSIIHETVYENRFTYVDTLNKMGAKIQLFSDCLGKTSCRFNHADYTHSCVISGITPLQGVDMEIPDLRAGFSYLVAAIMAKGTTTLSNIEYIERGYDSICAKLKNLGVTIDIVE